jgi:hypothetical protein
MALFLFLMWVGSLIAGYHHFFWWLTIPILFFVSYVIRSNAQMTSMARRNGLDGGRLTKNMLGSNCLLIANAIVQHSVLFGVGYAVKLFI